MQRCVATVQSSFPREVQENQFMRNYKGQVFQELLLLLLSVRFPTLDFCWPNSLATIRLIDYLLMTHFCSWNEAFLLKSKEEISSRKQYFVPCGSNGKSSVVCHHASKC